MPIAQEELAYVSATSVTPLISPDGKTVVLKYAMDAGQGVNIALDAEQSNELLRNLVQILSASLNNQTAIGGAGFVRMTPTNRAQARATDEPGQIALCLIDEAGVAHYYSFPSDTSAELRRELRSAENKARAGVRVPRA
jgi:hypothetical protein